jgi:hypothetical protein
VAVLELEDADGERRRWTMERGNDGESGTDVGESAHGAVA